MQHSLQSYLMDKKISGKLIMDLAIEVIDKKPKKIWNVLSVEGEIRIRNYKENFVMPIDWWSSHDYVRQWKQGLERLEKRDESCLVATIYDPAIKPWIEWYVLYKVKNHVHIIPMALYDKIYQENVGTKPFTVDTCYNFIPPRDNNLCKEDDESQWVLWMDK